VGSGRCTAAAGVVLAIAIITQTLSHPWFIFSLTCTAANRGISRRNALIMAKGCIKYCAIYNKPIASFATSPLNLLRISFASTPSITSLIELESRPKTRYPPTHTTINLSKSRLSDAPFSCKVLNASINATKMDKISSSPGDTASSMLCRATLNKADEAAFARFNLVDAELAKIEAVSNSTNSGKMGRSVAIVNSGDENRFAICCQGRVKRGGIQIERSQLEVAIPFHLLPTPF
jgi:hypothetical protein